MSTNRPSADRTGKVEQFAKGLDRTFVKLVYISPFALVALLLSDQLRDHGGVLIIICLVAAALWAFADTQM